MEAAAQHGGDGGAGNGHSALPEPGTGKGHGDGLGWGLFGGLATQKLGKEGWKRFGGDCQQGLVEQRSHPSYSPGTSMSGAASEHSQLWSPRLKGQKTALCMAQDVSEQLEAEQGR